VQNGGNAGKMVWDAPNKPLGLGQTVLYGHHSAKKVKSLKKGFFKITILDAMLHMLVSEWACDH